MHFFCALALLATAFAHRPFTAAEAGPPDLAAYALPGDGLPALCLGEEDPEGSSQAGFGSCDLCRFDDSSGLAAPRGSFITCPLSFTVKYPAPNETDRPRAPVSAQASPRGPPAGTPNA